jgi:phthiocerol/phenolphthiocerol synthesis type-I polyketide synthase E
MFEMNEKNVRTGLEIAVIGLSGRFPGAKNIIEFWENLKNGVESISFFSDEELAAAIVETDLLKNPGYVKANGYLDGKEYFDGFFFGYTPNEAEIMNPQLRIFHECAWEALEDAGYVSDSYKGRIGLYVGASSSSSWEALCALSGKSAVLGQFEASKFTDKDFLSTRVAYKLNLKGPCFSMQTACSTSLVAADLACRGLLTGQCGMALAGGVTLSTMKSGYLYQEGMVMSADGHCRAFDAQANGIVGGEGVGIVLLKPLEDAISDKDHIYAVIKGSAVNNDGNRKVGFSAPSIKGQVEVIRAAQHMAAVQPESISYVETHGTGTSIGDPIEINALIQAFNTNKKGFCRLGSVKANVGHLDAAAGITGLLKTILALKHRLIPPSLHFETPNPKVDFENSPFYVNTKLSEWKNAQYPLRAGVSSFGIGGTNAHMVLEEGPGEAWRRDSNKSVSRKYHLMVLSAKTRTALNKMTENFVEYLKKNPAVHCSDAAYTLQVGRKVFKHRKALVCPDTRDAIRVLSSDDSRRVLAFSSNEEEERSVVFMFSGQGSQYINMGLQLYQMETVFRKEFDRCAEILQTLRGYDIRRILYPLDNIEEARKRIFEQEIIQPLFFIFEYALAQLLMKWGIMPYAMIGYSIGEYVAACLSGVISLEDGIKLVSLRGKLMQEIPPGVMLNVPLCREDLEPLIKGELSLAVDNGESCIVSGSNEAITKFEKQMKGKKYWCMRLNISHAGHSKMMDCMLPAFEQGFKGIILKKPQLPYISNTTGKWITVGEAVDPGYWVRQLRDTVRFNTGIRELIKEPNLIFVEIGPGRALSTLAMREIENKPGHQVINLIRHPGKQAADVHYLLNRIGQLWLYGKKIDWSNFYPGEKRYRIPLPTYPFERQRFWVEGNPFKMAFKSTALDDEIKEENFSSIHGYEYEPEFEPEALRHFISSPYKAPRNRIEHIITGLWKKMFGFEQIGVQDDFFELGGDSLKVITVTSRIHKELNIRIPIEDFFINPTIEGLAGYIKANEKKNIYQAIKPVEKKDYYPLSSAQKRLYVVQQLNLELLSYNISKVLILEGGVKSEKFAEIFKTFVKRHESLRTSFQVIDDEPVQKIHGEVEFDMEYNETSEEDALEVIQNFVRPFNLAKASLMRAGLIKVGRKCHLLMTDIHHIISDALSIEILTHDFVTLYRGETLPVLNLQYKDYSEWQTNLIISGEINHQENYWLETFAGKVPVLNLPLDYLRPMVQSFAGDHLYFEIQEDLYKKLVHLTTATETTLYMVLLAVLNVLLAKYTGQEDIVVGSPISGRTHADLENIIGMFVGQLAMRNRPGGDKTFKEFLGEVKEKALKAYENQGYPFEQLVPRLGLHGNFSRNPLYDVVFALEDTRLYNTKMPGLKLKRHQFENKASKTDLRLGTTVMKNTIIMKFTYATALFKRTTVEKMAKRYIDILNQVLENHEVKLSDIILSHRLVMAKSNILQEKESDFGF